MIWEYADGTRVELGGLVSGSSLFAQRIRASLSTPPQFISTGPIPSPQEELNVGDPTLLDLWLEGRAHRFGVKLTAKPEGIPPYIAAESEDDSRAPDGSFEN